MAIEALKAIGTKIASKISAPKAEKAANVAVKDGAKMMAAGQDAAAVQGRAMVKPYVKPEMKTAKIKQENMMAASGGGGNVNPTYTESPVMPGGSMGGNARSYNVWGDVWGE